MTQKVQIDRWLFSATVGLALFGVVMVYSASAMIAQQENHSQFHYVIKQTVWTSPGFVAMFAAMRFDYQKLNRRWIAYGLLLLTILLLVAVFGFSPVNVPPRRMKRMAAFIDPWADAQGTGYQVVQSLIAVGSGGSHGLGFAQGRQKLLFLPFAHSDFIFAVIGEELGLVGGLIIVFVFAIFLWRGMRAALRAPDRFGMFLGIGIVVGIVAQALLNMSVVLALLPTKGIPLPFISYGGSSLVPTLASVGILLNISQYAPLKDRANEDDEYEEGWQGA